ncbi:hypothetical protein RJ640_002041 [Escallonia rubra]|uniref:MATH domain-containing protein n=1 Tax=Escallonia rubra TaxID=112253 RepID=A0AA88USM5_9ASTE|nr:hypothetical protein RJ640_002041 [Escallonia rubra]
MEGGREMSSAGQINGAVQDIKMWLRETKKLYPKIDKLQITTEAGVVRMPQDVPSVQYKFKIKNFSVLQGSKLEKYESNLFEACGHKCMNTKWGLAKLLPLDTFNDASNGFLRDDSCVIGVELVLVVDTDKGESISLVKDLKQYTHTWRIDGFSEKIHSRLEKLWSEAFIVGGDYKWRICLIPNRAGNEESTRLTPNRAGNENNYRIDIPNEECKFISVYLYMSKDSIVPEGGKVYAEYKLKIKNPKGKKHYVKEGRYWFTHQTYSEDETSNAFIDYPSLKSGFLFNDSLTVEAEIMTLCLIKGLN